MEVNKLFAKNVKVIRTNKGISQEKLGELAGLHRTYISQVERGINNPTLDSADAIARALDHQLSDLLSKEYFVKNK